MEEQKQGERPGRKGLGIGIAIGALSAAAVAALVGLVVVYTGTFNVAATEQHSAFGRWALDTTFHNSVETRARSLTPPEQVTPQMLQTGAASYKSMCEHCHAGPGVERARWADGMRPQPPHLAEAAAEWEPNEVFWIAKHGVKMTGMPAFGPTHDDQALWGIAAFVKELPGMEPGRYAALGGSPASHHADTGGASH